LVSERKEKGFPTSLLALSLITGFIIMLLVEQFGPHGNEHRHTELPTTPPPTNTPRQRRPEFDVELAELEEEHGVPHGAEFIADSSRPAYPLTVGLIIHGLADGLALGVSALSDSDSGSSSNLSLVVFMALAIHKGRSR
jgi:solute carrier family 39 (zinc transporter), member 9